jgi:hypothetical protein
MARSFTIVCAALCLLGVLAPAEGLAATSAASLQVSGPPPGFENLEAPREVLVDLYFGGRKIGDAFATSTAGALRFRDPQAVLAKIPNLKNDPDVLRALTGDLPTNSDLVCSKTNAGHCGSMAPPVASIIYDEDQFRAEIFISPRFLETIAQSPEYLPTPPRTVSLTSAFGLSVSGSSATAPVYNVQNRTIVGLGSARLRMTSSVASRLGWMADDLVAEVDRRAMRYSAGLFWAPGMDFTGQRRILGLGFGTQFDTIADRDNLRATPLILFLAQPARVEIVVDGRLVTSAAYQAGNNELDTSALPDGAYALLLRIHGSNGTVRDERRFFVKNSQVAPIGRPIYFGYAGLLANTQRHRLVSGSRTPFYQLGAAWRLTHALAVDVDAVGSDSKTLLEAGGWLITPRLRVRAAALVSTAGDRGLLVQLGSGGRGALNFTFDLRRIWTRHGQDLFPLPSYVISFDSAAPHAQQLGNGSYTQATGSIGYRLGPANLSLVGSYRDDRGAPADYSIGPSVDWPLLNRGGMQILFNANAQRTSNATAAFAGIQLLATRGHLSMSASAGAASLAERGNEGISGQRAVGSIAGQYSVGTAPGTQLTLEGGADRNIDSSTVHAGARLDSRIADARVDVLHDFEGAGGTQYGITIQSAAAASRHAVAVGANQLEQSAIILSVGGDARDVPLEVLVDDSPRGRISVGQRLSLFLPAYRSYSIRLVPSQSDPVMFDASAREVTLYPGSVETLRWTVDSYLTLFGQALDSHRTPIANGLVRSGRSVSETDANGYFQIDVTRGQPIKVGAGVGASCNVPFATLKVQNDYASIGKVVCK